MKVQLMGTDVPFDPAGELPMPIVDLAEDLGTARLLESMSQGDVQLLASARAALFRPLVEVDRIRYRQQVLSDCIAHPDAIRAFYQCALDGVAADGHIHMGLLQSRPSTTLQRAQQCLTAFLAVLRRLRALADEHGGSFTSPGLSGLCRRLQTELDDDYLEQVATYLRVLDFPQGQLQSARLGSTNRGEAYVLRRIPGPNGLVARLTGSLVLRTHTVTVAARDMGGMDALGELTDLGCQPAAEVMVTSCDHVLAYFKALRSELGFYVGCLNLHDDLLAAGQGLCLPDPLPVGDPTLRTRDLRSPLLALSGVRPVGNDVDADDGCGLVLLTGTNQGGKSTLLRALGTAQLMMQCGMFVSAEEFRSGTAPALHTHFKRAEDAGMDHGKFDEELDRFDTIVARLRPGDLVLCNESFSSTNEREAAVVGGDVVAALLQHGVRVCLVTHQYALADRLNREVPGTRCLRAVRGEDGSRPFRLLPGAPLRTSYADDLYHQVFGSGSAGGSAAACGQQAEVSDRALWGEQRSPSVD